MDQDDESVGRLTTNASVNLTVGSIFLNVVYVNFTSMVVR